MCYINSEIISKDVDFSNVIKYMIKNHSHFFSPKNWQISIYQFFLLLFLKILS